MKIISTMTDEAILAELGRRITRLRIDAGLTQAGLAAAAGIGKRTLERLEDGEQVQVSSLVRVLKALGAAESLDVLLPDAEIRPMDMLQHEGRPRQRASRPRRQKSAEIGWKWGDEK